MEVKPKSGKDWGNKKSPGTGAEIDKMAERNLK